MTSPSIDATSASAGGEERFFARVEAIDEIDGQSTLVLDDSPRCVRRQDSLEGSVSWDVPVSIRASFVSALSVWSPRCEPTIRASIRR